MPPDLIVAGILLAALSGVPGLPLRRSSPWGQWIATVLMCLSAIAGLAGAGMSLFAPTSTTMIFPWPSVGNSFIGVDALSAFFLVPVFLMGGLGSIYGLGYWPQKRHPLSARKLQFFWGLLVAGLALLVIGKHAMAFLFGWEMMALSAFFLVSAEDGKAESRRAGLIYLIATHIGTLTLFGLFALWRHASGSYNLEPLAPGAASLATRSALFLLALLGFGLKAGVMPLHFWLPGAHANAPSHVSAMLSGVVLKMGIYGLVRFLSLIPEQPAIWGALILLLGAVSGLLGVVFAIGQHDLKRLLAYHSVENIGIILMGLGLAMLGRSGDRPELLLLGLGGCLLHVWNHSLFKSLLFLGAGSVLHASGTRQIDHLGGLAKSMPWTAAMFLVGAVAICGLPPLNGFVSELFIYFGLFGTMTGAGAGPMAAVIVIPVLAMIGALALACFVKAYGAVFLGSPRGPARSVHESPLSMRLSMAVLAAACAFIGLAPTLVAPILDRVIAVWVPVLGRGSIPARASLGSLVPLGALGWISLALIGLVAALTACLRRVSSFRRSIGTWDCGYAAPTGRMQYTASSFAQTIAAMFAWLLRPHSHRPLIHAAFPGPTLMHSHVDELVLDRVLSPAVRGTERAFRWFHRFQAGLTQRYMLYILVTVALLLCTLVPFREIFASLLSG